MSAIEPAACSAAAWPHRISQPLNTSTSLTSLGLPLSSATAPFVRSPVELDPHARDASLTVRLPVESRHQVRSSLGLPGKDHLGDHSLHR